MKYVLNPWNFRDLSWAENLGFFLVFWGGPRQVFIAMYNKAFYYEILKSLAGYGYILG